MLDGWMVARNFLFGPVKFIDILVLLMFCDIVTGILKAIKNKRLRSRNALYGYFRKIGVFIALIVANVIDQICNLNGVVATGAMFAFILNEIVSIIENLTLLGVNIPTVITERLHVVQAEQEEKKLNPILEKSKEEV